MDSLDWLEYPNNDYPIVGLQLHLLLGDYTDPPGKEGLLSTTAAMMLRGAGPFDRAAFSEHLERLGGHLDLSLIHI